MLREALGLLTDEGKRGGFFVDATLGGGGHSEALLALRGDIRVIGLDQDPEAIATASARLQMFGDRFRGVRVNFREMATVLPAEEVRGILFDVGVSSHQFNTPERGFSFQNDGPLSMKMNPDAELSADQIINEWDEVELARIFWEFGDERFSRRIAKRIVEQRRIRAIRTTGDLAEIVFRAIGRRGKIHPATRVFQALRIVVNDELGSLDGGMRGGWEILPHGGRMVVISFHSLEDRMVKNQFRTWAKEEEGVLLVKKPLEPGERECGENPRARSAKLRGIEKNKTNLN